MLSEIHEVIVNAKLLQPGKIVRLSFINTFPEEYRTAAGTVEKVVNDGEYTTVTLRDFVDTYHEESVQRVKIFKWYNPTICDNFTGKWQFKIEIHRGTEDTLKSVAKKMIAINRSWIKDWEGEMKKLKREVADHESWIKRNQGYVSALEKRFGISSEKSK